MKTHIIRLLLLLLMLLPGPTFGQSRPQSYTVTYAYGPITYRPAPNATWRPLDAQTAAVVLSPQASLRLTRDATIALSGANGATVVLRDYAGTLPVASVQPDQNEVTSVLATYFQNLWRNLTHRHETVETYARGYMKRKGVVSRGDGCTAPLMLTPDYDAALPGDTAIRFSWKRDPQATAYTLAFYDSYDDKANQLYQTATTDTSALFVPDKPFLERGVTYYWSVFPAGKPNCARYTFTLAKTEAFQQLETRIAQIKDRLRTDAALSLFLSAALYESNHFYPEAHRAYFQAHRLAPQSPLYRDGLALFLARRGQTEQAQQLLVHR